MWGKEGCTGGGVQGGVGGGLPFERGDAAACRSASLAARLAQTCWLTCATLPHIYARRYSSTPTDSSHLTRTDLLVELRDERLHRLAILLAAHQLLAPVLHLPSYTAARYTRCISVYIYTMYIHRYTPWCTRYTAAQLHVTDTHGPARGCMATRSMPTLYGHPPPPPTASPHDSASHKPTSS